MDITEIFRIWTPVAIDSTDSRLYRLFHSPQVGAAEVCSLGVLLGVSLFCSILPCVCVCVCVCAVCYFRAQSVRRNLQHI